MVEKAISLRSGCARRTEAILLKHECPLERDTASLKTSTTAAAAGGIAARMRAASSSKWFGIVWSHETSTAGRRALPRPCAWRVHSLATVGFRYRQARGRCRTQRCDTVQRGRKGSQWWGASLGTNRVPKLARCTRTTLSTAAVRGMRRHVNRGRHVNPCEIQSSLQEDRPATR